MGFVPRRYDPAIVEALAMAGALDPELDRARSARPRWTRPQLWLDAGDLEARWTAELTEDGAVMVKRLWRGVTDAYPIEAAFLTSAEARKLARLAAENAEVYASPVRLVRASEARAEAAEAEADGDDAEEETVAARARCGEGPDHPPLANCSTRCLLPGARACRSRATRAWAK